MVRATGGPDVVDAIVALGESLFRDVHVIDTYTLAPEQAAQLWVGLTDPYTDNPSPSVTSQQVPLEDGYGSDRRESVTVFCRFVAPVDESPKAARDYLVDQLSILDAGLRADRSLGGVAMTSRLGSDFALFVVSTVAGDSAYYDFEITADVLL